MTSVLDVVERLTLSELRKAYNPNQPRVPKGSPGGTGGRFAGNLFSSMNTARVGTLSGNTRSACSEKFLRELGAAEKQGRYDPEELKKMVPPTHVSAEALDAVQLPVKRSIRAAKRNEARITRDVAPLIGELGGWREGEGYVVKSEDSLARKAAQAYDVAADNGTPDAEGILDGIRDVVRYTGVFPDDEYATSAAGFAAGMLARGYEQEKSKVNDDPSRGVIGLNTSWRDPRTGQRFEVQLLTPEAEVAKTVNHAYYASTRLMDKNEDGVVDDAALLPAYVDGVKTMTRVAKKVPIPKGLEKLPNFKK